MAGCTYGSGIQAQGACRAVSPAPLAVRRRGFKYPLLLGGGQVGAAASGGGEACSCLELAAAWRLQLPGVGTQAQPSLAAR